MAWENVYDIPGVSVSLFNGLIRVGDDIQTPLFPSNDTLQQLGAVDGLNCSGSQHRVSIAGLDAYGSAISLRVTLISGYFDTVYQGVLGPYGTHPSFTLITNDVRTWVDNSPSQVCVGLGVDSSGPDPGRAQFKIEADVTIAPPADFWTEFRGSREL